MKMKENDIKSDIYPYIYEYIWPLMSKSNVWFQRAEKRRRMYRWEGKKTDEDKQKVKLVKLLETGSDDGLAGPSPVISLSHFLDDVSNQWKPVAGHSITQLSSTTENI